MLDSSLLQAYMQGFYGYGNPRGAIWFIGMEKGGGQQVLEVSQRLSAWSSVRLPFVDIAEHHRQFGQAHWFLPGARTQGTWRRLIRTVLRAESDGPITIEQIRQFQIEKLGRKSGNLALLELLPLPKQSRQDWRYHQWTDLAVLEHRKTYEKQVLPSRIIGIQSLIQQYRPRVVIFFGQGFTKSWHQISQCGRLTDENFVHRIHSDGSITSFIELPHPVARCNVNKKFEHAGDLIRTRSMLTP